MALDGGELAPLCQNAQGVLCWVYLLPSEDWTSVILISGILDAFERTVVRNFDSF